MIFGLEDEHAHWTGNACRNEPDANASPHSVDIGKCLSAKLPSSSYPSCWSFVDSIDVFSDGIDTFSSL